MNTMFNDDIDPLFDGPEVREFIVLGYERGYAQIGRRPEWWTDEMSAEVERHREVSLLPDDDAELNGIADWLRPLFEKAIAPPGDRAAWAEFMIAYRAEFPLPER